MTSEYVLDVQSVSRKVTTPQSGAWVLEDINFTVSPGEIILISGKADSGKSLLMRIMTWLERPTRGNIIIASKDIARLTPDALLGIRATTIGDVSRDLRFLSWLTVRDTVALAASIACGQGKKIPPDMIDAALAICGITAYAGRLTSDLTYSIQKRVALSRALVRAPLIIFIDAVTEGLNDDESKAFLEIIHTFAAKSETAVVMTSAYNTAESIADSVYYLDQGVVQQKLRSSAVEEGSSRDIDCGLYVVDEQGRLITFNRKAETLLGFREPDVLGQVFDRVLSFQTKTREPVAHETLPEVMIQSGEETALESTSYIESVHGHWRLFALHVEPRFGAEGRRCGAVTTLKYIGEEQEIDRMKSDFAAIAAHELRTPLTTINGSLEMYLAMREGTLSAEDMMLLGGMKSNVVRLQKLVENLIRISRLEQGNFVLRTTELDWPVLMKASNTEYAPIAQKNNVALVFEINGAAFPKVQGDEAALREVVDNLVRNAIEHTPPGGSVKVVYSYDPAKERVETSIQNSGKGLSKEELQHLFTKFYRASKERTFTDMHLGLGLYITRALVDFHHGEIVAKSEEGQGATFSFWLPVHQPVTGA